MGCETRGIAANSCSLLTLKQSSAIAFSIMMTSCFISQICFLSPGLQLKSPRNSTICSSMSIKTPTCYRQKLRALYDRTEGALLSSATMRSRFIPSARRRCETYLIFLKHSILRPGSSHSRETIARRDRYLRPPTQSISLAAERFVKALWTDRDAGGKPKLVNVADENEQARFVVTSVLENREAGETLKSQAVLFRAAHHSAALELELTRRDIPFVKFGGLKFLDATHIKDTLALLRFAEIRAIDWPVSVLRNCCRASARGRGKDRHGGCISFAIRGITLVSATAQSPKSVSGIH